jgi:hypothetical protein
MRARVIAPEHVGKARLDQYEVAEPHDLHCPCRGADVAAMAGVHQDEAGRVGHGKSHSRLK